MISTYYSELKELMTEKGFGKCTFDQAYVFDKLGEENYKRMMNIIFEKCTIEAELEGMSTQGYFFGIRCKRKMKKYFCRLREKIRVLEKEKKDIRSLKLEKLDSNEIFTRTLEGMISN